jgi:hypothetical protein
MMGKEMLPMQLAGKASVEDWMAMLVGHTGVESALGAGCREGATEPVDSRTQDVAGGKGAGRGRDGGLGGDIPGVRSALGMGCRVAATDKGPSRTDMNGTQNV